MVTLHMYAPQGDAGNAVVDGGKILPGGDPVVTAAIETSVMQRHWTPEAAVAALDGQSNGYWVYSTSDVNPFDLPRITGGPEPAE